MKIKALVGSGDKVMLFALPFLSAALILNLLFPAAFQVGGSGPVLFAVSLIVLLPGLILWLWSVALVLTRVPKGELITFGPYALMKHPLYTSVALLVLPFGGFLLNTWSGLVMGLAIYAGSRLYAPLEEKFLANRFGAAWTAYESRVLLPWL